jgi:hypothetical protein
MAVWIIKTQHKKSAIEKQTWVKDGVVIVRNETYRWGSFYCESDTQPEIDLVNEDGYQIGSDDYEWELEELDDGCYVDWEFPEDMDKEEQDAITTAWEEDYFEGLEGLGWSEDDTDYILEGPLELLDDDGNTVDQGEPDEEED